MSRCAQHAYVKRRCRDAPVIRKAIHAKLDVRRTELLGPDPTLVKREVARWLQVQDAGLR